MESEQAKLFVGGVSRETTEETLKDYFGSYGTVLGSSISRDRLTNNPRGFGFVWFLDASSADRALEDDHVILGRTVDVKRAIPRKGNEKQSRWSGRDGSSSFENRNDQLRTRKLFVGGLSASLTDKEFRNYFEAFGRVTDVVVMQDSTTRRSRGFGFITFESEDSVENVMQKSFHELDGKFVEVKRAIPRDNYNSNDNGYAPENRPPYMYSPTPTYRVLPAPAQYNGMGGFAYGPHAYGGWYPSVVPGGVPYGIAPISPQPSVFPYGSFVYPGYMSGGVLVAGGYNGILGHPAVVDGSNQVLLGNGHAPANMKSSGSEGEKVDAGYASKNAATALDTKFKRS